MTLEFADLIGAPFETNGRDPVKGIDCWGICLIIFSRLGLGVPDYALGSGIEVERAWYRGLQDHWRDDWLRLGLEDPVEVGDVVMMRGGPHRHPTHVGVVVTGGSKPPMILHANRQVGTCLHALAALRPRIAGIYRYSQKQQVQ